MYLVYLLLLLCSIFSTINHAIDLSSSSRPSVAIVCFVKNNADILPFWLQYHVALVGIENIVVLDNFSNKSKTPDMLRTWQRRGLKVEWGQGPYSSKGKLTLAAFKKHFPKHQIGIPLDIDELVFGYGEDELPGFKKSIFNRAIQKYWQMKAPCLALNQYLQTCSRSENDTLLSVDHFSSTGSYYSNSVAKKIFHINAVREIDHGNHHVILTHGECVNGTNILGLIHYHFRNPKLILEHAIEDLHGFGYLANSITAENVKEHVAEIQHLIDIKVPGFHKAQEVLQYCKNGWKALVRPCDKSKSFLIPTPGAVIQSVQRND